MKRTNVAPAGRAVAESQRCQGDMVKSLHRTLLSFTILAIIGVAQLAAKAPLTLSVEVTDGLSVLPGAKACLGSEGDARPECRTADAEGRTLFEISEAGTYELRVGLEGFFTARVGALEVGAEDLRDGVAWRPEGCRESVCLRVLLNPNWRESFIVTNPSE